MKVNEGKDVTHAFDIFANPTDMENYGADAMQYAMENIKVLDNKVIKKGGRRCNAQDWATVHWQTFDNDGKKLEDSKEFKKKRPTVFKIGQFHVAKCWDIALVNMHAHEAITVKCPGFYAYGGTSRYGHFGNDVIPGNAELTFVLNVLECQPTIDKINDRNEATHNKAPRISSA